MERILIVEDEPKIADLLQKCLQNANFQSVSLANGTKSSTWVKALPRIDFAGCDAPRQNQFERVQKTSMKFSGVPIIMLTARVEEIDRLLGLGVGAADDYICKTV